MNIVVVAPHPDDETLGCGGTLLRHQKDGDSISWLIVTGISTEHGYTTQQVKIREQEIHKVSDLYHFQSVHNLSLPTTLLDTLPIADLIKKINMVFREVQPEIVYIPFGEDIHSDHRVVFQAVISCTKWFRHPYICRILAYETISETDMGLASTSFFQPNVFVGIEHQLEDKINILQIYKSEIGQFPFPRSIEAVKALAKVRGVSCGFPAAEAFHLLRERI